MISALAAICLRRYIEKTCQGHGELSLKIDKVFIKAYVWEYIIDLAHDFYEVDYLPENDRVRYTILPDTRKEVLKRLLKLNHEIHEQEVKAGPHAKGIMDPIIRTSC